MNRSFRRTLSFIVAAGCVPQAAAFAQEAGAAAVEVGPIVSDGRKLAPGAGAAAVWTAAELDREAGRPLGELLREAAGVDFTLGPTGTAGASVRGTSPSQLLVLIDGVKANDPSATNRIFDWSRLDPSAIDRIEVLKGPQTVPYGPDALGGVVLVRTKRGGLASSFRAETGGGEFYRLHATTGFPLGEKHGLRFQALRKSTGDAPGALGGPGGPATSKTARDAWGGVELASAWSDAFHTRFQTDVRVARETYDAGAFRPDPNAVARSREIRSDFAFGGDLPRSWTWDGVVSRLDFRRAYDDPSDPANPFAFAGTYRGTNERFEASAASPKSEAVRFSGGIEATRESIALDDGAGLVALTRDAATTFSVFGEAAAPAPVVNGVEAGVGARFARLTDYGAQSSGKGSLAYRVGPAFALDVAVASGFKSPSLYARYAPIYGNPDLTPETSVEAQAGATFTPSAGTDASLRVFRNRIRNRFGFDPATFVSRNTARAEVDGAEIEASVRVASVLRLRPHATYLDGRDRVTGGRLPDVSTWKGGMKAEVAPTERTTLIVSFLARSGRSGAVGALRAAGFARVDVTALHRLSRNTAFTARVENAFDRDYAEVPGYRSPGATAYVGAEFTGL